MIGFAAAPWTLACYMIEGRTRGDISRAKQMLVEQPQVMRELLERIARATAGYLRSQIDAGAAAVQLFDTWAGELSQSEYDAFELPATQMVLRAIDHDEVPKILFAKGSSGHLESMANSGADVLSVDWNTDLSEARRALGNRVALQGNVAPSILLGPEPGVRRAAREAVENVVPVAEQCGHVLGHHVVKVTKSVQVPAVGPKRGARRTAAIGNGTLCPD